MDYTPACMDKKKKTIDQSMLLCCKFFISESRNHAALDAIERAARLDPESVIVSKFQDRPYNRARYDIVSYVLHDDSTGGAIYSPLQQTVVAMAEAAFGAINLEQHCGAHPRLGVVDDIVFHPLARASLDDAAWLAKAVAADIGHRFQVPVYLYSAAHPAGKPPDTIRRELGYYRPNFMGNQWAGWTISEVLHEKPDEGPTTVSPGIGVTMIGARPWFSLYNVPILSTDVAATRRIARKVSARGGGLPTVQTLGLFHGEDSTEIAGMLLEPNQIGADQVQNHVEMLAAQEGFTTDIAAVRRIARRVSSRGGGLPSVQAMALAHGESVIEVACNLLEPEKVGGDRVQLEVERLAKEEGMRAGKGYFTDLSQEKLIEIYLQLGSRL